MKMHFIRNKEALSDDAVNSHVIEYEVTADAAIYGTLNYGPYCFLVWEYSWDKQAGDKRRLCLRVREKEYDADGRLDRATIIDGFFHDDSIADEIITLSSLFTRRRFEKGPVVRYDDKPKWLDFERGIIDEAIVKGEGNIQEIDYYFKRVENLESKYQQIFIWAVRLYHQAVLVIEKQPDMAYLNLVSSIETLCQEHPIDVNISDIDGKLPKLLDKINDEALRNKIQCAVLSRERFISRRFVSFVLDHVDESFWTAENRPSFGQVKQEELGNILARIYKQRSKTLHTGERFPSYIFSNPPSGVEIPFCVKMRVGGKWLYSKDFIPYPHFFERLVNHVLMEFLKKNSHR